MLTVGSLPPSCSVTSVCPVLQQCSLLLHEGWQSEPANHSVWNDAPLSPCSSPSVLNTAYTVAILNTGTLLTLSPYSSLCLEQCSTLSPYSPLEHCLHCHHTHHCVWNNAPHCRHTHHWNTPYIVTILITVSETMLHIVAILTTGTLLTLSPYLPLEHCSTLSPDSSYIEPEPHSQHITPAFCANRLVVRVHLKPKQDQGGVTCGICLHLI